jgi:pyridoxal phosphate-dependent aminotransferase EpsN
VSNTKKRIFLSSPHMSGNELPLVAKAFDSNWIAPLGPHVDAFEQELAEYLGVTGALALNSGTAAIHLALRLCGVEPGDTVFCSSLTFVASANPVLYLGAKPVFIDSEQESWNMSPAALEQALYEAAGAGKLPRAVIVVNIFGQSADMDAILGLCNQYRIPVIEDAAESLGATYKGKPSGTLGKFGIFSFNGNKIITAAGGGMLVSNETEALVKARFWATQARDQAVHYQHSEIGYNYRLSNVLAAIGRGQLRVLDERINARRAVYAKYLETLSDIPDFVFMPEAPYGRSTRWLTTMTVDSKRTGVTAAQIIDSLIKENIEARPVWKPLHLQPLFRRSPYYPHGTSSYSDYLFENGICLPSGSNLTEQDVERVVDVIRASIGF